MFHTQLQYIVVSPPLVLISLSWLYLGPKQTSHGEGANIVASKIDDPSNPVSALNHHLSANASIPSDTPFFAFETDTGGWAPMMRPWFSNRCNEVVPLNFGTSTKVHQHQTLLQWQ
jgi:hypothetical protein